MVFVCVCVCACFEMIVLLVVAFGSEDFWAAATAFGTVGYGMCCSCIVVLVGLDLGEEFLKCFVCCWGWWWCGLPMLMCRWEDDTSKRFGLDSWGSVLRKGGKAATADVDTASAGDRDGIKETGEKSVMNLRACWSCLCLCGGGDNRESAKKGD